MEKKACTFFGHRDSPETIKPKIRAAVIDLIENHGVTMFYVGNQGNFDRLVRSVLKEVTTAYPGVGYAVVLAYMPSAKKSADDFSDTLLPDGIEKVPKRFAISWRNKWMIEHADYVVTYVTRLFGGAAQFSALAKSKGKIIYDIK
ncbi:hypothetical protein H6B15_13185 [Gemmiger formicilis]|uniref:hypothetical protein n=1 Tax=Gemmiger formicilis TaxID=745368 RepID=UPI00195B7AD3|nr:hypothetical protein [Gemmiger formicilis]MBM6717610.1 hypothetical protein [Gemmiger formicilis]